MARPGPKSAKDRLQELEKLKKEAETKIAEIKKEEAKRIQSEISHAKIMGGVALIEAIARGSWPVGDLQKFEEMLVSCVSRPKDTIGVRRLFEEGRRIAAERGIAAEVDATDRAEAAVRRDAEAAGKSVGEMPNDGVAGGEEAEPVEERPTEKQLGYAARLATELGFTVTEEAKRSKLAMQAWIGEAVKEQNRREPLKAGNAAA